MKKFAFPVTIACCLAVFPLLAVLGSSGHDEHGEHHEHSEEGGANVGPEKGITEMSERRGFKLSPEAMKTFRIQAIKVGNGKSTVIPPEAYVASGGDIAVYRLRSGYFKRIPVHRSAPLDSRHFQQGDELVIRGASLLRVAEMDALSGESHGHSH